MIQSVIELESSWNPNAVNLSDPTGAYGLGQILFSTAQGLGYTGTPQGLLDPATNINLIAKLISQLIHSYGDDFRRVYSAYNSGNPDLWKTSPQVAANVARAMSAALKFTTPSSQGVLVLAVGFLLVWIFRRVKK
jgi:soluble lytic murein transglycosylase-like protein